MDGDLRTLFDFISTYLEFTSKYDPALEACYASLMGRIAERMASLTADYTRNDQLQNGTATVNSGSPKVVSRSDLKSLHELMSFLSQPPAIEANQGFFRRFNEYIFQQIRNLALPGTSEERSDTLKDMMQSDLKPLYDLLSLLFQAPIIEENKDFLQRFNEHIVGKIRENRNSDVDCMSLHQCLHWPSRQQSVYCPERSGVPKVVSQCELKSLYDLLTLLSQAPVAEINRDFLRRFHAHVFQRIRDLVLPGTSECEGLERACGITLSSDGISNGGQPESTTECIQSDCGTSDVQVADSITDSVPANVQLDSLGCDVQPQNTTSSIQSRGAVNGISTKILSEGIASGTRNGVQSSDSITDSVQAGVQLDSLGCDVQPQNTASNIQSRGVVNGISTEILSEGIAGETSNGVQTESMDVQELHPNFGNDVKLEPIDISSSDPDATAGSSDESQTLILDQASDCSRYGGFIPRPASATGSTSAAVAYHDVEETQLNASQMAHHDNATGQSVRCRLAALPSRPALSHRIDADVGRGPDDIPNVSPAVKEASSDSGILRRRCKPKNCLPTRIELSSSKAHNHVKSARKESTKSSVENTEDVSSTSESGFYDCATPKRPLRPGKHLSCAGLTQDKVYNHIEHQSGEGSMELGSREDILDGSSISENGSRSSKISTYLNKSKKHPRNICAELSQGKVDNGVGKPIPGSVEPVGCDKRSNKSGVGSCSICYKVYRGCYFPADVRRSFSHHVFYEHTIQHLIGQSSMPMVACEKCGFQSNSLQQAKFHKHDGLLADMVSMCYELFCFDWSQCFPNVEVPTLSLVQARVKVSGYSSGLVRSSEANNNKKQVKRMEKSKKLLQSIKNAVSDGVGLRQFGKRREDRRMGLGRKCVAVKINPDQHNLGFKKKKLSNKGKVKPLLNLDRLRVTVPQSKTATLGSHVESKSQISSLSMENNAMISDSEEDVETDESSRARDGHLRVENWSIDQNIFCKLCKMLIYSNCKTEHVWAHLNQRMPVLQCKLCSHRYGNWYPLVRHLALVHGVSVDETECREHVVNYQGELQMEYEATLQECFDSQDVNLSDTLMTWSSSAEEPIASAFQDRRTRANAEMMDYNASGSVGSDRPTMSSSCYYRCFCSSELFDSPSKLVNHVESEHTDQNAIRFYVDGTEMEH